MMLSVWFSPKTAKWTIPKQLASRDGKAHRNPICCRSKEIIVRTRKVYYKVFALKDGTVYFVSLSRKPRKTKHGPRIQIDDEGICTWFIEKGREEHLTDWAKRGVAYRHRDKLECEADCPPTSAAAPRSNRKRVQGPSRADGAHGKADRPADFAGGKVIRHGALGWQKSPS